MFPLLRFTVNTTVQKVIKAHGRQLGAACRQQKGQNYVHNRALATVEHSHFMEAFPSIVKDLQEEPWKALPEVAERFTQMIHYTVPNGKRSRGLAVVASYKILEKPENLTPETIRLANIMGWCLELIQSSLILLDDIVDQSETRRGVICWYKKDQVGLQAINDSVFLLQSAFHLLKKHFSTHHYYVPTMELFHDVLLKLSIGQSLEAMCVPNGRPNFDLFTLHMYHRILTYKADCYNFVMPVTVAMYMANLYDTKMHKEVETVLMDMGHFFQIQDDFLDSFGDPELTGKKGNDIQEGKCSWLAVMALQKASSAQRKVMEECYGRPEPEAVQAVRNLYQELKLPEIYADYEEESFNKIRNCIQQTVTTVPHELFLAFLEKLYRRKC